MRASNLSFTYLACHISLQADIVARLEKAKSGDEPFSATASSSNGASNGAGANNSPGWNSNVSSGSSGSSSSGNTAANAVATPPAKSAGAATGGVSTADLDGLSVRDLRTMVS